MVRVDKVVYLGQKHTRLSLIKKTANLPPEAPMDRSRLLAAETRLYNLNIFDWSASRPKETDYGSDRRRHAGKSARSQSATKLSTASDSRSRIAEETFPRVQSPVPGLPTVGLGNNQIAPSQSTFASPLGSIEFTRRNMRGVGETASGSVLLSRLDQRALPAICSRTFLARNGVLWPVFR